MIEINVKKKLYFSGKPDDLQINVKINSGDFISVFGPSGSGKTSFLRLVAGLTVPDSGRVSVDGEIWYDSEKKINLPPMKRSIGFIFQDYALFPNMTVRKNLEFACKDRSFIEELLEITELQEYGHRYPSVLSGGQKQRVAVARALMRRPEMLLLDEPLSALHGDMREKMGDLISMVNRRYGTTIILVSHNIDESTRYSTHSLMIEKGRIIDFGKTGRFINAPVRDGEINLTGSIMLLKKTSTGYSALVEVAGNIITVSLTEEEVKNMSLKSACAMCQDSRVGVMEGRNVPGGTAKACCI